MTSDKIYGLDLSDDGPIGFQLDTEATKRAIVERVGIDLDETQRGIRGYKVINRLYPQADTKNSNNTTLTFEFVRLTYQVTAQLIQRPQVLIWYLTTRLIVVQQVAIYPIKLQSAIKKTSSFHYFDLDVTATGKR